MRQPPAGHGAERHQVGAAVVVEDALRPAARTRRVVERERVPLVVGQPPLGQRRLGQQLLVRAVAEPLLVARRLVVGDVDDGQVGPPQLPQRRAHLGRQVRVGQQHARAAVVEDVGDRVGVETRVDRVKDRARQRHPEMGLVDLRRVRRHHRHDVAALHAEPLQRPGQTARTVMQRGIAVSALAVPDREPVRMDVGGPRQERQRRSAERDLLTADEGTMEVP